MHGPAANDDEPEQLHGNSTGSDSSQLYTQLNKDNQLYVQFENNLCATNHENSDTEEPSDGDCYYECDSQSSEDSFQSCTTHFPRDVQDIPREANTIHYHHPDLQEVTDIITRSTRRRQKNKRKRHNRKIKKESIERNCYTS